MAEDFANVRLIGKRLAHSRSVRPDLTTLQTNTFVFSLVPDAANIVECAQERGVLPFPFGAPTLRLVTRLDVMRE